MAKWFLKNHDFIHVNSSVAGEYNKHKQDGSHLRFPIRMILATVDVQVTSILPMNFWVNCPFGTGEKNQNRFSRRMRPQFGISYRNHLSYFFIYKSPRCFLPSFESIGLSVQKKKGKIDFQDGHHLGFDWNNFSYFYIYKSSRCFLPIFKSTGPLVQENKWKKRVSDPNNLSYFRSTSHPNASYQVSSQMAFQFRRRSEKKIFKMAVMVAILDFW